MATKDPNNQAVAISFVAIDVAKAEQDRLKEAGVKMSLGAIVSKAVIETYKGKE